MNHSLGNIDERDTKTESNLEMIAHVIKESTDKYFPYKQRKRREFEKTQSEMNTNKIDHN